jgi:uncharacterized protein
MWSEMILEFFEMLKVFIRVTASLVFLSQCFSVHSAQVEGGLMFSLSNISTCFLAGFAHDELEKREVQPSIQAAFNKSDRMVIEVVTSQPISEMERSRKFKPLIRDDVKVDREISELNEKFLAKLKPLGNWLDTSSQVKAGTPSHLYAMFIQATGRALHLRKSHFTDLKPGVDKLLLNDAFKRGMPIVGLESQDLHTNLWYLLSDVGMRRQLLIDNYNYVLQESLLIAEKRMQDSIYIGNLKEFEASFSSLYKDFPSLKFYGFSLLGERNKFWVNKILDEIQVPHSRPCFISVGAGHLVGENGLLNLLENRGVKIERVTP